MTVGDIIWYRHLGYDKPLAAIVVNAQPLNVLVLDNGTGLLTDDLFGDFKRDVVLRDTWAETEGGECARREL